MTSAAALGPYARASALDCKGIELLLRGHTERSDDKMRAALEAARAVGAEDCLVTAYLTIDVAEAGFICFARRPFEHPVTFLDQHLNAADKLGDELRQYLDALTGAAAVARRRRAAGMTRPAEQSWYMAHHVTVVRGQGCSESLALKSAKSLASLAFDTTVFAATTALYGLRVATAYDYFNTGELLSRLGDVCNLVDEAVALAGPQRVKGTLCAEEGLMKERLRVGIEAWRLLSSTAAHADRLAEALQLLCLHGALNADAQARDDQDAKDARAKVTAARSAASAPELLRSCALASCGTKEAHVSHFSKCAACKTVVYCSKTCQTADWPAHKKACKAARKAADEAKTASAINAA